MGAIKRNVGGDMEVNSNNVRHCIVCRKGTFSDYNNVYLLLSYIPGGELLRHLTKAPGQCFPTDTARFYTASIVLALEYLHDRKIVYR